MEQQDSPTKGLNNDRFGNTTILIYPGEHVIDNRPGFIPDGLNTYRMRNGLTTDDLPPFDLNSNFDVNTATNELYKTQIVYMVALLSLEVLLSLV